MSYGDAVYLALAVLIGLPAFWVLIAFGTPWVIAVGMCAWAGWEVGSFEQRRERRRRDRGSERPGEPS